MRFYLLDSLRNTSEYARFSHLGTWGPSRSCRSCGYPPNALIEPLLVEWDIGTTRIGDFSWCGSTCIVTDRVRDCLIEHGYPCRFSEAQYVAPKKARGLSRRELKQYGRIPFPYEGPHLSWLMATAELPADVERSQLKVEKDCTACGVLRYRFRCEDLTIAASSWNGEKMFQIEQNGPSGATFVTDEGLAILQRAGFTNFIVRDAGVIAA